MPGTGPDTLMKPPWHHWGLSPVSLRGAFRLRPDCQCVISDIRPLSLLCHKSPGNRKLLRQPVHLQRWAPVSLPIILSAATWMILTTAWSSLQPPAVPQACCRACCWPCPWAWCCWHCWCLYCGSIARDRMGGGERGKKRRRTVTMRYGTLRP